MHVFMYIVNKLIKLNYIPTLSVLTALSSRTNNVSKY